MDTDSEDGIPSWSDGSFSDCEEEPQQPGAFLGPEPESQPNPQLDDGAHSGDEQPRTWGRSHPGEEPPLEIEDYTCASPWETFIAEIEATLRRWAQGPWGPAGEDIPYRTALLSADYGAAPSGKLSRLPNVCAAILLACARAMPGGAGLELILVHVRLRPRDLGGRTTSDVFDDFPNEPGLLRQPVWGLHEAVRLCAYFGAAEYLLLRPAAKTRRISPDLTTWLLSSALIAARSVGLSLPVYVPSGTATDTEYEGGRAAAPFFTGWQAQRCSAPAPCKTPKAARMIGALTTHFEFLLQLFQQHRSRSYGGGGGGGGGGTEFAVDAGLMLEASTRFTFRTTANNAHLHLPPSASAGLGGGSGGSVWGHGVHGPGGQQGEGMMYLAPGLTYDGWGQAAAPYRFTLRTRWQSFPMPLTAEHVLLKTLEPWCVAVTSVTHPFVPMHLINGRCVLFVVGCHTLITQASSRLGVVRRASWRACLTTHACTFFASRGADGPRARCHGGASITYHGICLSSSDRNLW